MLCHAVFIFSYWKIKKNVENALENTGINCWNFDDHPAYVSDISIFFSTTIATVTTNWVQPILRKSSISIFTKHSIDVWQGSEYTSAIFRTVSFKRHTVTSFNKKWPHIHNINRTTANPQNISVTLANLLSLKHSIPVGNYMFKVNNKTSEPPHWLRSGVFIVNFEYISHHVPLIFLLVTLSRCQGFILQWIVKTFCSRFCMWW